MRNAFNVIGGLILILFIGAVFTTILMKLVMVGIYFAVGIFVVLAAILAYGINWVFRRRTRLE